MLRVRWDVLLNVALLVCYCGFLSLRAAAGLAQSTSPDTLPQQFLTPVIVVLIESRWYHLVTHFAEKFTHLNAMLERRLQREISGDAALSEHEVRWFGRAHWRLSDLVRNLDSYFGLQVLLFLAYRCVHLVTVFYSIVILNVDRATYPYRPIEYYTQTFWAFMRTGQLLADVLPCHGLTAQAKRTAKIAIQYRKSLSEGTRQQVDELLVQLAGLEVQFTAYGLFPINNSIIISIASAVTTYLVVVMQFQNSDVGVKTTATVNPPM